MKYSSGCPNTLTHQNQVSMIAEKKNKNNKNKKACVSEILLRGPFINTVDVLFVDVRCEPFYTSTQSLSKVVCSLNISLADFKLSKGDTEGQRKMVFLSSGCTVSYFTCLVKVFH